MKALAVTGSVRSAELPDVPSSSEIGLGEPDFTIWNGMLAPAATPAPVLEKLRAALRRRLELARKLEAAR